MATITGGTGFPQIALNIGSNDAVAQAMLSAAISASLANGTLT